ncbi:hypothetical protein BGZ67_002741 [Mortierella alpina]|nr:hypothetical protein BGZ67_002741 [Mortierella alpina]
MSLLLSAGREMVLECVNWSGGISEFLRAEGDADNGEDVLLSVVGETAPEEVEQLLRWRLEEELREAIGNAPVSTVEGIWVGAKVNVGINGWSPVMLLRQLWPDVPPGMWILDSRSDKLFEEQDGDWGAEEKEEEGVVGGGDESEDEGEDEDKVASEGRGGEDSSEGSEDESSAENEKESGEDGRRVRDGGSLERTASATEKGVEEEKGEKEEREEREGEDEKDGAGEGDGDGDEKGRDEDENDGNKKEDSVEEVADGLQATGGAALGVGGSA